MGRTAINTLNRIWTDRQIKENTKIKLVKALIFPIIMCDVGSWTIQELNPLKFGAGEGY